MVRSEIKGGSIFLLVLTVLPFPFPNTFCRSQIPSSVLEKQNLFSSKETHSMMWSALGAERGAGLREGAFWVDEICSFLHSCVRVLGTPWPAGLRCLCLPGTGAATWLLTCHHSLGERRDAPSADTLPVETTLSIRVLYCLMVSRDVRWFYKKKHKSWWLHRKRMVFGPRFMCLNVQASIASTPWSCWGLCVASMSEERVKFSLYATPPPRVMESQLFFSFSLDGLGKEIFNLNWPTLME